MDSAEEGESESDDEAEASQVRPYMALLQGFADTSAPKAKRRKLDHSQPATAQPPPADLESEDEEEGDNDVDHVDEPEDTANEPEEQPEDDSSDEEEGSTDPFDVHFAHADETRSTNAVKSIKEGQWTTRRAMVNSWRGTFSDPSSASARTPHPLSSLDDLHLKRKLKEIASKKLSKISEAEKHLMSLVFGYSDVLHCDRTIKDSDFLRRMVCLHALNHVFK